MTAKSQAATAEVLCGAATDNSSSNILLWGDDKSKLRYPD